MNEFNDNEVKDKPIFNADKFTYHEGELVFYDFPCQVCSYYNNGDRSDKCPMDLIDKIVNYEIKCPNFHDKNAFDWDKLN